MFKANSDFLCLFNPFTRKDLCFLTSINDSYDIECIDFENQISWKGTQSNQNIQELMHHINPLIYTNEFSTSEEIHIDFIKQIRAAIQTSNLEKVIAAKIQVYESQIDAFKILDLFEKLKAQLPDTLVYCFYFQDTIWLGASPELVGRTDKSNFHTISLAGTIHSEYSQFTEKEEKEQALVTHFLDSILGNQGIKRMSHTIKTFGNISHLMNDIVVPFEDNMDFHTIIDQIHPSPALAGLPKSDSIEYILNNESIKREWYCGKILWEESGERYAYALIRCVKITGNQAIFYAGGGITQDSDPKKEWIETDKKIDVLKKIILE